MPTILIAEDDKFLTKAYALRFTKAGYKPIIVDNGEQLISTLETTTPDIILLDLIMPVEDGFQVLKELKSHKKWKSIPVIISSNLSQSEDILATKHAGADDYFVKTDLNLSELISKVDKIVRNKTKTTG